MKQFRSQTVAIAALLITLLCASSVYAWGPGGKCPRGGGGTDTPRCGTDLNDEQRDQLTALRQKFIDETAATRIALNTAQKNLDILLATSQPDKKAIKALIDEIMDLKAAMMEKRINHQLEVKKISPNLGQGRMLKQCNIKRGAGDLCEGCPGPFSPGCCR